MRGHLSHLATRPPSKINLGAITVLGLLCMFAVPGSAQHNLGSPTTLPTPTSRFVGDFLGPPTGQQVAAQAGSTIYLRTGVGRWEPVLKDTIEGWTPHPLAGDFRLRTGESVLGAVRIGNRWLGRIHAGVVESLDAFRSFDTTPVRFGFARVLAVARRATDAKKTPTFWVASDSGELCLCDQSGCESTLTAPILSIRSFEDGVDLAGDAEGGLWRFHDGTWIRQRIADSAIVRLDGVFNGGPRYAATTNAIFESKDHGETWTPTNSAEAAYAWGDGGRHAWRDVEGRLQIRIADESFAFETTPPLRVDARVIWAGPRLIVIDDRDGVHIVEIDRAHLRFLRSPESPKPRVHTAIVTGSELRLFAGERLQYYSVPAVDGWGVQRLMASMQGDALVFLVVFVIGLAVLWLVFDIGLRRRRRIQ